MFPLLYKYLILNDHVSIPGIGHFTIEKQSAKLDVENNVIHPPASTIKFKDEKDVADKAFYNFLSGEMKIDVVEAIRQFQDFAFQLKNNISSKKVVVLPAFGTLKMKKDKIKFLPLSSSNNYYPSINIEHALSLNEKQELVIEEEEITTRKSYWWLSALILTVIGVGAILYYYYVLQD